MGDGVVDRMNHALDPRTAPAFSIAAAAVVNNTQLRKNVRHATDVIQAKRARVVAEVPDWQALRDAGQALRAHTMRYLDAYLLQFEENCRRAGGHVHWAANAEEARAIVVGLAQQAIAQGQPSPAIAGHPAGEVPGTHPGIGEASHTPMRGESSRSSR